MITSKHNEHFKRLLRLHKRKEREEEGVILVEGEKELLLAPRIETVYYTERTESIEILEARNVSCIPIAEDLFQRISYRERGVIGIVPLKLATFADLEGASFLLLVEGIEKPGNLGAMMRSCDGAGAEGLIIIDPAVDVGNPNVVRASLGAFFSIPIVVATKEEAIAFCKKAKIEVVITTPHVSFPYYDIDYKKPICIVIGSEALGVSKEWASEKVAFVSIPMLGKMDSLNASVSAAILLYEVQRQRRSR